MTCSSTRLVCVGLGSALVSGLAISEVASGVADEVRCRRLVIEGEDNEQLVVSIQQGKAATLTYTRGKKTLRQVSIGEKRVELKVGGSKIALGQLSGGAGKPSAIGVTIGNATHKVTLGVVDLDGGKQEFVTLRGDNHLVRLFTDSEEAALRAQSQGRSLWTAGASTETAGSNAKNRRFETRSSVTNYGATQSVVDTQGKAFGGMDISNSGTFIGVSEGLLATGEPVAGLVYDRERRTPRLDVGRRDGVQAVLAAEPANTGLVLVKEGEDPLLAITADPKGTVVAAARATQSVLGAVATGSGFLLGVADSVQSLPNRFSIGEDGSIRHERRKKSGKWELVR